MLLYLQISLGKSGTLLDSRSKILVQVPSGSTIDVQSPERSSLNRLSKSIPPPSAYGQHGKSENLELCNLTEPFIVLAVRISLLWSEERERDSTKRLIN